MPAVFSRFSPSPSSTDSPAMRTSATVSSKAWVVDALPISDKDVFKIIADAQARWAKAMEPLLSARTAASTSGPAADGDASGGSLLGGSCSHASDATNPKEHASSHPSSSSTVPRDEKRVSTRAIEVLDNPSHPATAAPTVATTADTTESWVFGLFDEDALDVAANQIAPFKKGCGSDDLAARKAKHAAERRFPQRSLWTPPAHFVPPVDEFWMPHSSSMMEWPTVSSPPHLAAPVLVQSEEEEEDDSDKENQAPVQNIGTFIPARTQASRHFTHRRVLSALTAGSNSTRNTYLDASTTVASPSVFPFALLKEKGLVSRFEGSDADGF